MIEPRRALLFHFIILRPEVTPILGAPLSSQVLATSGSMNLGRCHTLLFHSGTELPQMAATTHIWLFKLKLNKVKNLVPPSHQAYFYCSVTTCS